MKTGTRFGVLGTGIVGQTIAGALSNLGHAVMIGTRDPAVTLSRSEPGPYGNPSFSEWRTQHPDLEVGTYAQAAGFGDVVVVSTNGAATLPALDMAGKRHLSGKLLVDTTNPLDFSRGFPPSLLVCNTDSLGERIQQAYPEAKVVKTLNTVNAFLMVGPKQLAGGDHTMFLCGNDADAKATTREMLAGFGWTDILDLGDITNARGMEMYLPLWVRLFGALQNPMFSVKVVR